MDNSAWETVLIEWINCLKLSKVIRNIHDLRDGDFFVNLQRLTNKKQTCDVTVFKFLNKLLEEHYPNCTIKCRNEQQFRELPDKKLKTLTSLVLHYTCIYDRRDLLTSPLCHCLSQNTQLVIRNFLQTVEGNVSYNELDELINKCLQKRDLEKFSPWGCGRSVESSHSPLQDILKTPISKTGRLQEKDREINRLKSDLALEIDEKNDLKVEVRVHCDKNKKLEFQLTQKNLEIQRLRTEIIGLENRTPPHFQDIDSRKIQNSLQSEIQSLELYIQQIETEQELMRNQKDQTKQKAKNLEIQNEELKTKLYDLEKQLDFSTTYNSEQDEKIMVLQSHCNELSTLLEELQSKPTETTMYDSFHHSTRRSIANYSSCENLATSVVEIQLQDCQKLNEQLQDLLKQSENFGSDLKTDLASLKADLEVAQDESTSVRKENAIMLLKITDLKEEVCTTKSDLLHCIEKLIEQETQASERNCKFLELQDELLNLKNQLQLANCSKEEISFNLDALQKINLELEEENLRFKEKLIEQETQASERNCKFLELQDELLNLKNQLQLANCSKEEISFNLDALQKINLELEEENLRFKEKLIEQETQTSERNCKLLGLQDELLNLKNQSELANSSKEEISFNLDALQKINLELEEENLRFQEKLIEQETQASERNCKFLELQDELLNLKNQLQLANCSKEEISFNLDALQKINLELEEENLRFKEKLIEQETQTSERNCKLLGLQDELLNLKNQSELANSSKEEISFNLDALQKINLELEEENLRFKEKLIEQETQTSERNCKLLGLQDELLNLKNQLQLANSSIEEISFNLDALQKINLELEEENLRFKEKLIEQETQTSERNCKLLGLQDEVLNLKNQLELANCSKEEISFNLDALQKINLELEEENLRFKEKLIEQETQTSERNCKLLGLQDELLNLKNQSELANSSKEEISSNLESLKKINLDLEEENLRCNEKLIEQTSERNCKLLKLQDELLKLKNQLELANSSKEEISSNLESLKKINLDLEEENLRCNEKLIEQETQTSERNCKLLELQDELLNLKNQLELANCSKEEISFNLDALQKVNLELEEENLRFKEKLIEQETQTSERNYKLLELQDELLKLKNQLELANSSKEEISSILDSLKKINLDLEEENLRCNEKLIEQETQTSERNYKLLELQDELLNLKNQLELSNSSGEEISSNLEALKNINLGLENENLRCNEKLIEQETQTSERNCKLLELQDELLILKKQLQLANSSKEEISSNLDALKNINLGLQNENLRCNEQLIEQETQTSERNCKLLELQDELLNLKNQLELANSSGEEISSNLEALKNINLGLENENLRCKEQLIEQEAQTSERNYKLLELQDELIILKKQLQLANSSKEEISSNLDALKNINLGLQNENLRCNEQLIEQETQTSERNCKLLELLNLKNQLELANSSKEEVSSNLDALKKVNLDLEEENLRCIEKLIEQETQISERNCKLLELQDELLNLKNQLQLANSSKEEISSNLDALKKINLELEEENLGFNEKLIEQETQTSERNCKLLELQDELLELKNQLQLANSSKEEISSNLDALKKINLELEEENLRCNEKLIEQETKTSERNYKLLELQDELLKLKNQLQLANSPKEEISFNLDALKKINLELEEKNCEVKRSVDALNVEKQQLENKLNRLESKLAETKEQQAIKIANYDEELARIEGHYEIILSEHKGTFDNLKMLNEKITADLGTSKTEIRSLQETIADLSTQKKQLERGLSNGESKIARKSDQIASLKRELAELEDRHSECKSVIDENVNVIDTLRFKNEKLLVDIDALNGDMLNMRKKRNVMLESQKRLIEETEANVSRAHSNAIDVKNDLLKRVEMAECDRNEHKRELEVKLRDAIEQKRELEMKQASLTVQLETIRDENARQLESIRTKLDSELVEKAKLESRLVEMEAEYDRCCRDFEVERARREGELKVKAAERYKRYEKEIEDLMKEKENWTVEKSQTSSRIFQQEECNSLRANNEYLKEKQTELQQKIDVLANSSESILNCYNSFKTSYGQFASKLNSLILKKNVLDSLTSNLRMQLIAAQKNLNVDQGNFRQLLERKETYEIIAEDIFKYYNKYSKQIHEMLFETMQVYERSCDSIFANMDVKIEGIYERYKVEDFVDQICDLTDRTMDVLEQLKAFNKDLGNATKTAHKPPKENILGSSNKLNLNVEKMKEDELKKKVLMFKQKLTLSENAKSNLEKKVKQLREENKNILQKPVTLDDDVHYKMLLQEHIACKEEHEQILKDCNLQYDKLKKEYDDLKTTVTTPVVPKIELDECNVKLQHDLDRLRQAYASVVSDNDKLMAENVKLKATVDEYKTEVTTFLSIKEAYDKLLEDNNKLMTDVDTIRYKRSRDRDEYIRLLKKEREEHQSKDSKRIQEVRGDYEAKLEKMKDKMIKLYRYEVNKEMNRVKAGQNENTSLLKVIEQLKGDLFESEQKIHLLETECEIIKSRRPQTSYDRNAFMDSIGDRLSICSNGSLATGPSVRDHANSRRDTMNRMYPGSSATMDNRRQVYRQMDERRTSTLPRTGTVIEEITIARRTSIGMPNGMGSNIQMEDEDEMFNNKYLADLKEGKCALQSTDRESTMSRVSQLAWRNSMVPPHLKSSYPAETQFCSPGHYKEEDIKVGNLGFDDSLSKLLPSDKQRKKDFGTTSYKKPGPPTPSKNGGRLSLQSNEVHPAKEQAESKTPKRLTPGRIKALFTGRNTSKSTSEVVASPKSRRLNIFRKPR